MSQAADFNAEHRRVAGDHIALDARLAPGMSMKNRLFNLMPPAMIVLVVLFWWKGPAALVNNPWTMTVIAPVITVLVLLMELVHERHSGWRMNRQEFFTDLFYVVLGATAISWASDTLANNPLIALKHALGIATPWATHLPFLVQVAMAVFIIEFGQYWMHRLMHNTLPFWLTHAPHHHITQLNAAKGAVGNPIELFLISLSVLALFDVQQPAMFAAFGVMTVVSTFAHANVRSDPPLFYSFFFTTIQHHSLHHSTDYESTRCNYANSLILIDRVFGTFRSGESVIVGQDDRKRLTIWEQTIFPFVPVIEAYKVRKAQSSMQVQPGSDVAA